MSEVFIIGIDLAKRVFHLHSACGDGSVVFRKKLSRGQVQAFFAQQPICVFVCDRSQSRVSMWADHLTKHWKISKCMPW